jgi:hypothetical protein
MDTAIGWILKTGIIIMIASTNMIETIASVITAEKWMTL